MKSNAGCYCLTTLYDVQLQAFRVVRLRAYCAFVVRVCPMLSSGFPADINSLMVSDSSPYPSTTRTGLRPDDSKCLTHDCTG
jgi:hypothetical protein